MNIVGLLSRRTASHRNSLVCWKPRRMEMSPCTYEYQCRWNPESAVCSDLWTADPHKGPTPSIAGCLPWQRFCFLPSLCDGSVFCPSPSGLQCYEPHPRCHLGQRTRVSVYACSRECDSRNLTEERILEDDCTLAGRTTAARWKGNSKQIHYNNHIWLADCFWVPS